MTSDVFHFQSSIKLSESSISQGSDLLNLDRSPSQKPGRGEDTSAEVSPMKALDSLELEEPSLLDLNAGGLLFPS